MVVKDAAVSGTSELGEEVSWPLLVVVLNILVVFQVR